jgi:hypothetical protein
MGGKLFQSRILVSSLYSDEVGQPALFSGQTIQANLRGFCEKDRHRSRDEIELKNFTDT